MPGPRPHPTALRLLRGNPSKRGINRAEPKPGPLATACPDELLDPVARAEWDRVAPGMIVSGQVTVLDRAALIGYCVKYAQWQALELEARGHPFLVRAPSGYPMPNPALGMANKAFNLMLKAAAELGMTPAGRSRVHVSSSAAASAGGSPWADVLP